MGDFLAWFANELNKVAASDEGSKKEKSRARIPLMLELGAFGAGDGKLAAPTMPKMAAGMHSLKLPR